MLQAPTNDRKTKADASAKTAELLPEQEQSSQLLDGMGRVRQSQPFQQRENLAALQKVYGNQALLRMSQAQQQKLPVVNSSQGGVLQRKCACSTCSAGGKSDGLTGEDSEFQGRTLSQQCRSPDREKPSKVPSVVQEELRSPVPKIQPKLKIGEPNDEYEQEADRVAEQVMRMAEPAEKTGTTNAPTVPLVQRKVSASGNGIATAPPIVHDVLSSPGQPLDAATRAFFEPRFGHDFSSVRVHSDRRAAASARAVDALAYTMGSDMAFGADQYKPRTVEGTRLLTHELTHVVQQAVQGPSSSAIQRAPVAEAGMSTESAMDERFLNEVFDFLESFQELRQRFADLGLTSSAMFRVGVALSQFDQQWQSMNKHARFGTDDLYWLLSYARQALGAFEVAIPEASARVRTESDFANLDEIRRRFTRLNGQLAGLEGTSLIAEKGEEIEETRATRAEAALAQEAVETARRETPEGRREDALAFTRVFVANEHQWWPQQALSTAGIFAERLGDYYLREKKLSGTDIQMVLATLHSEDPETLDRALYQGELLVYLFNEGVTGLSAAELPRATGSGFYNGFEFTWRDLVAREPLTIPSLSAPTPSDIFQYELGAQWGVLVGIKDGFFGSAQDVRSMFQVETYTQLFDLVASQIWDEQWRYEMGTSFATALHAYIQDVRNDVPFEIGKRLGSLVGQAVAEIFIGFLTAGAVTVVSKILRGTRWGTALLDFAEDFAHAMPWRDSKVVEDVVPVDVTPPATVPIPDSEPVAAPAVPKATPPSKPLPTDSKTSGALIHDPQTPPIAIKPAEKPHSPDIASEPIPTLSSGTARTPSELSPDAPHATPIAPNQTEVIASGPSPGTPERAAIPEQKLPETQIVSSDDLNRRAVAEIDSIEPGHEWMMDADGNFYRCSEPSCTSLRLQHGEFLMQLENSPLRERLEALEKRSKQNLDNPDEQRVKNAEEILRDLSDLEKDILEARKLLPTPPATSPPSVVDAPLPEGAPIATAGASGVPEPSRPAADPVAALPASETPLTPSAAPPSKELNLEKVAPKSIYQEIQEKKDSLINSMDEDKRDLDNAKNARIAVIKNNKNGTTTNWPIMIDSYDLYNLEELGELIKDLETVIKYDAARLEKLNIPEMSTELKKKLRHATPSQTLREKFRRTDNIDQVFGGVARSGLSPDHIVTFSEIIEMDGFSVLSYDEQKSILNWEENLVAMDLIKNNTRGNKRWQDWKADAMGLFDDSLTREAKLAKVNEMIGKENRLRVEIKKKIDAIVLKRYGI